MLPFWRLRWMDYCFCYCTLGPLAAGRTEGGGPAPVLDSYRPSTRPT